MPINRRHIFQLGASFLALKSGGSHGQPVWPVKPIRLLSGYPPGGSIDGVARPLLPALERALGQPVVMDYKPGANGSIAAEATARATSDGYVIHLADNGALTILPHARRLLFDGEKSFTPLGTVATGGSLLVAHPSLGVSNLSELIELAKSKPGKISYGTSGVGGVPHLTAEMFQSVTGIRLNHVPYKGGGPAMSDLLGGQLPLLFSTLTPAVSHVQSGKIKALGISSTARSSALPDVPTFAEQKLKNFDATVWIGLLAPAGLSKNISSKLQEALKLALEDKQVQAALRAQGYEPGSGSAVDLIQRTRGDSAKWGTVIKTANIKFEN